MDARERDESQPRRMSIKRPWDEASTAFPDPAGRRLSIVLPPVDAVPRRKLSVPQARGYGPISTSWYAAEPRGLEAGRAKIEGHDYLPFARQETSPKGKSPQRGPYSKLPDKTPKVKSNYLYVSNN
jgi:hypothetical protein